MHLDPTRLATPLFILLVIAEMLFIRFTARGRYEPRDTAASLLMGFGSVLLGIIFAFIFIWFFNLLWPYRLFTMGWSFLSVAACFVLDDLIYYAWHRSAHRIRWLWAEHVTHHSSQHYNLSTALRQAWGGFLTFGFVYKAPLVLLGFPLPMIVFVGGINLIYQFWIHTETIGRFPRWFEAVMNTPSHHRVHHATNAKYLDANYAGVFIVWDRMFGSFIAEDENEKPRYGLVRNVATFNPFKIAFHGFIEMGKDLSKARSLRDVIGYIFAPPGWSPDGSRETTASIKARWTDYRSAQSPAE